MYKIYLYLNTFVDCKQQHNPVVGQRRNTNKIKPTDLTWMQYEVLVEQKKKIHEQIIYYQLMNKKLRLELDMFDED